MKNIIKYWWIVAFALFITCSGWFLYNNNERSKQLQSGNKIVEFYRTVPNYFVANTHHGVIVISNQEHSRTVSLITSNRQKSLKINGRVYEIVRNGSFLDNPDRKWYNLSLPESVTNEIIEKQIVSVNGIQYAIVVGVPDQ